MAKAFKDMTLDEVVEHRQGIKSKIDALHDEARAAKVVQDMLIQNEHVERAKASLQGWADKNGKTLEEAAEYWQGRLTENGDPGRWLQSNIILGKPGKVQIG